MCADPKILAEAMKSYPRAEDLNTRDCTLEDFELLDLPNGSIICHQVQIKIHIDLTKFTTVGS